jgi:hypothetical protein
LTTHFQVKTVVDFSIVPAAVGPPFWSPGACFSTGRDSSSTPVAMAAASLALPVRLKRRYDFSDPAALSRSTEKAVRATKKIQKAMMIPTLRE